MDPTTFLSAIEGTWFLLSILYFSIAFSFYTNTYDEDLNYQLCMWLRYFTGNNILYIILVKLWTIISQDPFILEFKYDLSVSMFFINATFLQLGNSLIIYGFMTHKWFIDSGFFIVCLSADIIFSIMYILEIFTVFYIHMPRLQ